MTMRCSLYRLGTAIFVLALLSSAIAHDDNLTHTRITEAALTVIESAAAQYPFEPARAAYAEFSTNGRINWGRDFRYSEDSDSSIGLVGYLRTRRSVVTGSALEDEPATRVGTHFRNAYTGAGSRLTFGDPFTSEIVGHRYFDQAVEVFGYIDVATSRTVTVPDETQTTTVTFTETVPSAKELGFFLLGHSLHHVEDTSSIAHAHNDLHVTLGILDPFLAILGVDERDDYEANYIPTLLWDANETEEANKATFRFGMESRSLVESLPGAGETSILEPMPVDDFTDIWAVPTPGGNLVLGPSNELTSVEVGLGRSVFNLSVMQGELGDPLAQADFGCAEAYVSGELGESFNQDGAQTCTITFDFTTMPGFLAWCIDGEDILVDGVLTSAPGIGCHSVGKLSPTHLTHPVFRIAAELVLTVVEDTAEGWWPVSREMGPRPAGGGDYFYIEQLMDGIGRGKDFDQATLVRPPGLRSEMSLPYAPGNPVNPNEPDPANTSFGRSQPVSLLEEYVEKLVPLAVQYAAGYSMLWYDIANLPPYLKKVRLDQDGVTRYEAEWFDQTRIREMRFINESLSTDKPQPFVYVHERNLSITTLRFIDPAREFTLIVEFNEPVVENGQLGIEIRFDGVVVPPTGVKSVPPPVADPWLENREFELTFDGLEAAFPGGLPEGEIQLTVQAYDRNYHRNNDTGARELGAMLDQQPGTPARRQRINPDRERRDRTGNLPNVDGPWGTSKWIEYPWHDDTSSDVAFPGLEKGGFAYDRDGTGDNTHVLMFDSSPPEAALTVQN